MRKNKKTKQIWVWWLPPIIMASGRLRRDCHKLKTTETSPNNNKNRISPADSFLIITKGETLLLDSGWGGLGA